MEKTIDVGDPAAIANGMAKKVAFSPRHPPAPSSADTGIVELETTAAHVQAMA
jgi:hypothetical protein